MSKKFKNQKSKLPPPLSPRLLLPRRLAALLSDPALEIQTAEEMVAALAEMSEGVKAPDLLNNLLRAHQQAAPVARQRLNQVAPGWLRDEKHLPELQQIVQRPDLEAAVRATALGWLEAGGADASTLAALKSWTPFHEAYAYDNGLQGFVMVLWYDDAARRRVRGLQLLIDHNPPWEGAVKDAMVFPAQSPQTTRREFVEMWERRGMTPQPLRAEEAKAAMVRALECNRREGIRLPADLIAARHLFDLFVLPLPDAPGTSPFTLEEFDALSQQGKTPEELNRAEQLYGYRTRTASDGEVLVFADFDADFDDDFFGALDDH